MSKLERPRLRGPFLDHRTASEQAQIGVEMEDGKLWPRRRAANAANGTTRCVEGNRRATQGAVRQAARIGHAVRFPCWGGGWKVRTGRHNESPSMPTHSVCTLSTGAEGPVVTRRGRCRQLAVVACCHAQMLRDCRRVLSKSRWEDFRRIKSVDFGAAAARCCGRGESTTEPRQMACPASYLCSRVGIWCRRVHLDSRRNRTLKN